MCKKEKAMSSQQENRSQAPILLAGLCASIGVMFWVFVGFEPRHHYSAIFATMTIIGTSIVYSLGLIVNRLPVDAPPRNKEEADE